MSSRIRPSRISFEGHLILLAFLAALPGSAGALFLIWSGGYSSRTQITVTAVILGTWLFCAVALRERVVFSLQTLSNLLGALREGDFSVRGRSYREDDALGEVMR